jgi:murein L,D-transpeptidase YafK
MLKALAKDGFVLRRLALLAGAFLLPALLAGCGETPGDFSDRAYKPLSPQLLALMQAKGTTPQAPMLIRAFKKEAEVQVWKMKADGHYTLLKSYPICRWSGQLGPKTREGDRQVPEGFYTIGPAQMNPRSNYYLSFNVGYPNTYDRAHGYTGGNIMVHGVCSSAGCFSMTDQQIAEIYAIAREAFNGGQRSIQMESFPFHMTTENLARYRMDPNIAFWKELKVGDDNFEVTKKPVVVDVCNEHYVFNAVPANGGVFNSTGACPPLKRDETVALAVAAKQAEDNAKVAELVAEGVRPVHTVYADGGQNPQFAARHEDVSRPDALAVGAIDMPLDQNRKAPSLAQLEAAKRKAEAAAKSAERKAAAAHAFAYAAPVASTPVAGTPGPVTTPPQTALAQIQMQPAARQPVAPPQAAASGSGFKMPSFGRLFAVRAPARQAALPVAQVAQPRAAQSEPAANPPLPPHRGEARVAAPDTKPAQSKQAKTAKAAGKPTQEAGMPLRLPNFSAFTGDH